MSDHYPQLRAAILNHRWEGWQSAYDLVDHLECWTVSTIRQELAKLHTEGLLWRSTFYRTADDYVHRFAWPRNDVSDLIIPRRGGVRRIWQPSRAA